MAKGSDIYNEQLDLMELAYVLWFHKLFIMLCSCLGIFLGAHYALTTDKEFVAKAIFQIEKNNGSGISLPSELGSMAMLAGLTNSNSSGSEALLERIKNREFILKASSKLKLHQDKFFNSYDPNRKEAYWKTIIKNAIGWQNSKQKEELIIQQNVVNSFKENVETEVTPGGAISISVKHNNPEIAAKYANQLMQMIKTLVEFEELQSTEKRLNYLSATLADALQDMETTQKNLKNFTLRNSALAQESFLSGTLKLEDVRIELKQAERIAKILDVINNLVISGELNTSSYVDLRKSYPYVDDARFRRILGMSETISDWSWPDKQTLTAVYSTLADRITKLNLEISGLESEAKEYASSAAELEKLTRATKVSEATYTVLIEQVKSQSLAAGFRPDTFKVFQSATPPLNAYKPNRKLIVFLGAILGFFSGAGLSILNSIRRGVYYTKSSLLEDVQSKLALHSKTLRKLSRQSFEKFIHLIDKQGSFELDEVMVNIASTKVIFIFNSGSRVSSSHTAKVLASYSALSGRKVALCDTSAPRQELTEDGQIKDIAGIKVVGTSYGYELIDFQSTNKALSLFTNAKLRQIFEDLFPHYDQIFVCTRDKEAFTALSALSYFDVSIIYLSRLRKTKKKDLERLRKIQTIGTLFYE